MSTRYRRYGPPGFWLSIPMRDYELIKAGVGTKIGKVIHPHEGL